LAYCGDTEARRQQLKRYMEQCGVDKSRTNVLVGLRQQPDKPEDTLAFLMTHLGVSEQEAATIEHLRYMYALLTWKYDMVLQELQLKIPYPPL
ncbi:MYCBP protein, partial [Amia calva]|nr:MYCBP protein [Amia calva]